jgi:hypothetical protein
LIELSEPSLSDGGLISSVDFTNMEAFYLLDIGIVGHKSGKRNSQVVSKSAFLTALVLEIVDKFRILSVFASQDFFEFKNWSIYLNCTVLFEYLCY